MTQLAIKSKQKGKNLLLVFLTVMILGVFVIPPALLLVVIHQHVDYWGSTPLKEVHDAQMYALREVVHTLKTEDGEEVWCAEVAAEHPKGVILYLAGITKPSVTQFYGHAAWLREQGFASFLLEVRAHGSSTGGQIGLGYTEVEDVRAAVEYIKSCPDYQDVPLIIWGVSMGGAIAINAFGQLEEIDACIAMSPYSSFAMEIDSQMRRLNIPKPIRSIELFLLDQILNQIYGKETVGELFPEKQIQNANGRPVFLIACEGDHTVPVENTYILEERVPEADVWIRDSGDHFVVKNNDFFGVREDTEYCSRIEEWLTEAILVHE